MAEYVSVKVSKETYELLEKLATLFDPEDKPVDKKISELITTFVKMGMAMVLETYVDYLKMSSMYPSDKIDDVTKFVLNVLLEADKAARQVKDRKP